MELRIWSLCGFFAILAVVSHCTGKLSTENSASKIINKDVLNAHVMERRSADDDDFLGDEGIDDEAQKDEGNDIDIEGVIQTQRQNYTVEIGQTVRLNCLVTPESVAVVNWGKLDGAEEIPLYFNKMKMMKQDNPLYSKTEIINEDGYHDLVIHNVQASDSGEYRCQLPQTEPVFVVHSLRVKPRIISFTATDNGSVPEGADLVLTCTVEGLPPPQILWSRVAAGSDGANIRLKENDGEFGINTVTIRNVKGHHSGRYYCYAMNSVGNTQKEIDVTVLEKPHAHIHKLEMNTGVGVEAVFQCSTKGIPVPQITWFKDNVPVLVDNKRFTISTSGLHSNLTVVPASTSDFGTYTCVVQNYHGVHNRSAELVQRPVIDDVDVDGARVSFRVHSHLPLDQVELQLMDETGNLNKYELPLPQPLKHSYDFSYQLTQGPGTYQAFLRAKNEKEWSRNIDPIKVNIEAEPINIQKSSIYLPNDAHSFRYSATLLSSAFMYLLIRML